MIETILKLRQADKARYLSQAVIGSTLALLSVAAGGQQSAVPGTTALDAEEQLVRQYSVELIVFEYLDNASSGTEVFDPDEPPPEASDDYYFGDLPRDQPVDPLAFPDADSDDPGYSDDSRDLKPAFVDEPLELIPTYEQAGLKVLGPENYVLDAEYARLVRLDAYRPLMRAAWTQPTLEKDLTVPIHLRRLGNPPLRLDGTVTLYLSRYLHLVMDLALEEDSSRRAPSADSRDRRFGDRRFGFGSGYEPPATYFRIEEDRIVRNGELRYFDHPRFGVLAKISRVEENDNARGVSVPGSN